MIDIIYIVVILFNRDDYKFIMGFKMVVGCQLRLLIVMWLFCNVQVILRILMSKLLIIITFDCIISSNQLMTNLHMRRVSFVVTFILFLVSLFHSLFLWFYLLMHSSFLLFFIQDLLHKVSFSIRYFINLFIRWLIVCYYWFIFLTKFSFDPC